MKSEVTVAIPAHGLPDLLVRLLRELDAQAAALARTLDVIVSDDATPSPLAPHIEASDLPHLNVHVIRSDVNGGPGAARNRAIAAVQTSWVAFIDADMTPGEGWLAEIDRLVATTDASMLEAPVSVPGVATPFTHATEIASDIHTGHVIMRVEFIRSLGGFDERFYDPQRGVHFREDTELHFRLADIGAKIEWAPSVLAHHPPLARNVWSPVRLARRYHFDPLLSREHTQRFRSFARARRIGPISLRAARHLASLGAVLGVVAAVVGAALGLTPLLVVGAVVALGGFSATGVSLAWRRQVVARDVPPLIFVSLLVPWVYLWHYYRGVVKFRHAPRLLG
jgi:GT2 family glycosyltransferase